MNTILLACLAPLGLLAACHAPQRASIGSEGASVPRDACCDDDCDMTAECRPDGTCVLTCTLSDGTQRVIEVECDAPCGPGACGPDSCDVSVECLSDGRARLTCTSADGSTCEKVVDCCADAARCSGGA